jgi:hypothetical protein
LQLKGAHPVRYELQFARHAVRRLEEILALVRQDGDNMLRVSGQGKKRADAAVDYTFCRANVDAELAEAGAPIKHLVAGRGGCKAPWEQALFRQFNPDTVDGLASVLSNLVIAPDAGGPKGRRIGPVLQPRSASLSQLRASAESAVHALAAAETAHGGGDALKQQQQQPVPATCHPAGRKHARALAKAGRTAGQTRPHHNLDLAAIDGPLPSLTTVQGVASLRVTEWEAGVKQAAARRALEDDADFASLPPIGKVSRLRARAHALAAQADNQTGAPGTALADAAAATDAYTSAVSRISPTSRAAAANAVAEETPSTPPRSQSNADVDHPESGQIWIDESEVIGTEMHDVYVSKNRSQLGVLHDAETIVASREQEGGLELLVHWKGCSIGQRTWEKEANVSSCDAYKVYVASAGGRSAAALASKRADESEDRRAEGTPGSNFGQVPRGMLFDGDSDSDLDNDGEDDALAAAIRRSANTVESAAPNTVPKATADITALRDEVRDALSARRESLDSVGDSTVLAVEGAKGGVGNRLLLVVWSNGERRWEPWWRVEGMVEVGLFAARVNLATDSIIDHRREHNKMQFLVRRAPVPPGERTIGGYTAAVRQMLLPNGVTNIIVGDYKVGAMTRKLRDTLLAVVSSGDKPVVQAKVDLARKLCSSSIKSGDLHTQMAFVRAVLKLYNPRGLFVLGKGALGRTLNPEAIGDSFQAQSTAINKIAMARWVILFRSMLEDGDTWDSLWREDGTLAIGAFIKTVVSCLRGNSATSALLPGGGCGSSMFAPSYRRDCALGEGFHFFGSQFLEITGFMLEMGYTTRSADAGYWREIVPKGAISVFWVTHQTNYTRSTADDIEQDLQDSPCTRTNYDAHRFTASKRSGNHCTAADESLEMTNDDMNKVGFKQGGGSTSGQPHVLVNTRKLAERSNSGGAIRTNKSSSGGIATVDEAASVVAIFDTAGIALHGAASGSISQVATAIEEAYLVSVDAALLFGLAGAQLHTGGRLPKKGPVLLRLHRDATRSGGTSTSLWEQLSAIIESDDGTTQMILAADIVLGPGISDLMRATKKKLNGGEAPIAKAASVAREAGRLAGSAVPLPAAIGPWHLEWSSGKKMSFVDAAGGRHTTPPWVYVAHVNAWGLQCHCGSRLFSVTGGAPLPSSKRRRKGSSWASGRSQPCTQCDGEAFAGTANECATCSYILCGECCSMMKGEGGGYAESQSGSEGPSTAIKGKFVLLTAPSNYVAVVQGLCSIGRLGEHGETEAAAKCDTPTEVMVAQLVEARGAKGSSLNPHQLKRRSAITSAKPTVGADASLDAARTGMRRMTAAQFNVIRGVQAQRRATLWGEAAVLASNALQGKASYVPADAVNAVLTPDLMELLEPQRRKRAAALRAVLIYRTLSESLAANPSPSAEDEEAVTSSYEIAEAATAAYLATFEEELQQPEQGECSGSSPTLLGAMTMTSTVEEREARNQARAARRVRRGGGTSVAARPPVYGGVGGE